MKLIEVQLPDLTYTRLSVIAKFRGTTVTNMLVELGHQVAHIDPDADAVLDLWARGLADAEIAAHLGWTNQKVAIHRRRLQLPANPRRWINGRKKAS